MDTPDFFSHLLTLARCSSEVFMGFVKSYIQLFAYSSVTTEDWKTYLLSYFKDQVRNLVVLEDLQCSSNPVSSGSQADVLKKVDWTMWMSTPGMPSVKPQ